MPYEWKDKVVLITGAATGIGAGVVQIILAEGVKHVAVLDIAEQAGITLQNASNAKFGSNKLKFYKCDVTNEEQFLGIYKTVTDEQEYVDVVINNAAIMNDSLPLYKLEINLNITTLVTSTLKAYELMRKDRGGRGGTIINISSIAGLSQSPMLPIYFATKSAVLQFSNCMGFPEYYNKSGVRVLTLCFGATDTALLSLSKLGSFDEEVEAEFPEILKSFPWQTMESAAQGLVDAYKQGESGSTWLANSNKPHVAILDVDEKNGVELQNELNNKYGEGKVKFYTCDVTKEDQLVGNFESILGDKSTEYVVINNAGILNDSLKTYKKQIEINVTALITGSLKALELMRKDQGGKGGTIINISSVAALSPLAFTPIYNATKGAVLVFSNCLGMDEYYSRSGVRVLTICFGATDTGLIALENMGSFDQHIQSQLDIPMKLYPGQRPESAAQSVVDAYKQGKSGSTWLSNANKPAEDITEIVKNAYTLMSEPIFK